MGGGDLKHTESFDVDAHPQAYRPDIDGLRAVAVTAVILYHANVAFLGGGFVGVDIFFVISGFLITRMLVSQLALRTFSLGRFYERRIRRIFPALMVVLTSTAVMAWIALPPPDVARVGDSLAASALFLSNLYFLWQGSYYAPAAQQTPLLHVWSLSVEEQFYLLFPLLLLACHRWLRARYIACLAALGFASLTLAVALGSYSASAAFYFGGARAWELLLGGLLAFVPGSVISRGAVAQVCGLAGSLLIGAAVAGYPAGLAAPGLALLLPCAGAGLVIIAGARGGWVTSALSARPLVFLGLISYSLYLWHWPVLVFFRTSGAAWPGGEGLALALVFVLAALSWHFVEKPFRRADARRAHVFGVACLSVIALLLLALLLSATKGGAWRFPPHVQWLYSFDGYRAGDAVREDRCFLSPRRRDPKYLDHQSCLPSVAGKPTYLLVGDSHAAHLWHGLAQALPEATVQQATASGCGPLLYGPRTTDCVPFMDHVLRSVVPLTRPDVVILAARWSEADRDALRATVDDVLHSAKNVIVLGPSIEYREALPRILALSELRDDPLLVDRARMPGTEELDGKLEQALQGSGARYVSLWRALCPAGGAGCTTVAPLSGAPLQFDYGHFTVEGSVLVGARLRAALLVP